MNVFAAARVILGLSAGKQSHPVALVCVTVQSFIKPMFPQASVKDRAGVFLHRISSGS